MARGRKPAGVKSIKQTMAELAAGMEQPTVGDLVSKALELGVNKITAQLYAKQVVEGKLEIKQVV